MKWTLLPILVTLLSQSLACAQSGDPIEDPFQDPFLQAQGFVSVDIGSLTCTQSGNQISASATFRASTAESYGATIDYYLRIREYMPVLSPSGGILTAFLVLHSNRGTFYVEPETTVTWGSSITDEYVDPDGSYLAEARIHGVSDDTSFAPVTDFDYTGPNGGT